MKLLLPTLLAIAPMVAHADAKSEAKRHIQRATELHAASKFPEALAALQRAYELDPKPELLYAMGQVHVQLGNCTQAIAYYERYLATKPGPGPTAAAREAIESCQRVAPSPEAAPSPEPLPGPARAPAPTPAPARAPAPAPAHAPGAAVPPGPRGPAPWYTDLVGGALVGAGVAAGVVGVVFYRQMSSKLDDADAAATYDAHQDARDAAATKRNLAIGFGAAGALLVGAGIVRYVVRDRGERAVAIAPSANGVTVMGWF